MKRAIFVIAELTIGLLGALIVGHLFSWAYLEATLDSDKSYKQIILEYQDSNPDQYLIQGFWDHRDFPGNSIAAPLWGYSMTPFMNGNSFGFEDPNTFPYKKNENEFVIGVFGGSVASHWATYLQRNPNRSLEKIAKSINVYPKNIVILNMALGAMKQPQQFIISSYFSDSIDLAINIDGYNDLCFGPGARNYPSDFPIWSAAMYYQNSEKAEAQRMIKWSRRFLANLHYLPKKYDFLYSSSLYFLFWQNLTPAIWSWSHRSLLKLETNPGFIKKPMHKHSSLDDRYLHRFNSWKKFTIMQAGALQQVGVPSYFFLQPTIQFEGSKSLSQVEQSFLSQEKKLNSEPIKYINRFYPKMISFVEAHKKTENLKVFDLTKIFKDTEETTYTDGCCHLNDYAQELMTEKIINALSETKTSL